MLFKKIFHFAWPCVINVIIFSIKYKQKANRNYKNRLRPVTKLNKDKLIKSQMVIRLAEKKVNL